MFFFWCHGLSGRRHACIAAGVHVCTPLLKDIRGGMCGPGPRTAAQPLCQCRGDALGAHSVAGAVRWPAECHGMVPRCGVHAAAQVVHAAGREACPPAVPDAGALLAAGLSERIIRRAALTARWDG